MHLRGPRQGPDDAAPGGAAEQLRGTFLGVAHPAVIEHLRQLQRHHPGAAAGLCARRRARTARPPTGATTGVTRPSATSPPHPGYAAVPGQEVAEFAAMVDALHAAGIEVVLDVVYNHTCEGGPGLSVDLSTRGLAPESYYLPDGRDLTGTGNTVNARTLPVIRLVTDSLRYWAETLGRGRLPVRPGLGARPARRRAVRRRIRAAVGDRGRSGAVHPQTDRRAVGRHRGGLRGRAVRAELDRVERPVPRHQPRLLARRPGCP